VPAGELVGGLFYHNYPGGAGLMAGSVFFVEDEIDYPFNQIEKFVAIGVHLSRVRRAFRHSGLSGETTGDVWKSATTLRYWLDRPSGGELDWTLREVDRTRTLLRH
jgi:hypothetical protein